MKLHTNVLPGSEVDPLEWDQFVKASPQGSLYTLHGYASAIKPDWQAAIVKHEGEWVAVMPLAITRKWGMKAILQPTFAQYWGVLFADQAFASTYRAGQWEKEIISELIPVCDSAHLYTVNFSPEFSCSLPFHWQGFHTHVRYTQALDLRRSSSETETLFAPALRRQIRKGERAELILEDTLPLSDLLGLIELNHQAGNAILANYSSSQKILTRISDFLIKESMGHLMGARDREGRLLAAGLWAEYQDQGLYLIGAYHPDFRNSGAMSWLLWQAIQFFQNQGKILFDFEGSMIKGIEHFFAKFDASHRLYFQIHKNQLPLPIRWIHALR